jgi:hypothetical protein
MLPRISCLRRRRSVRLIALAASDGSAIFVPNSRTANALYLVLHDRLRAPIRNDTAACRPDSKNRIVEECKASFVGVLCSYLRGLPGIPGVEPLVAAPPKVGCWPEPGRRLSLVMVLLLLSSPGTRFSEYSCVKVENSSFKSSLRSPARDPQIPRRTGLVDSAFSAGPTGASSPDILL